MGLVAGVVLVGAATYPGRWFPVSRQESWIFSFPLLGSPDLPYWLAAGLYYGAVALLGLAWMWLLRVVTRTGCSRAVVLVVFAVWAAPLAVGPPVGSDDAVAYAAAGELVEKGFDPYEVGIDSLGEAHPTVQAAAPVWRGTPQPYGPLFLRSAELASRLGGSSFRSAVMVLRVANQALLALLVLPLSYLARRYGSRPAVVLAAVLCSPLVLLHLVGGVHNEAFMLLPLLTGVALGAAGLPDPAGEPAVADEGEAAGGDVPSAAPRRWALVAAGVTLCGVAVSVKIPAIVAAAVLGWLAAPRRRPALQVLGAVAATALAAAVAVAISLGTGLGTGWVRNLGVPQKVYTILAPFDAAGLLVKNGLAHLGRTVDVVDGFRTAGLLLGLVAAAAFAVRADRIGLPVALGGALLVLAFTAPVLWVWYFTWGFVFVALRGVPVWMQATVVILNLSVTPLGPGTLDANEHPTVSALIALVLTAALALVVARDWWTKRRRAAQGQPVAQVTER